MRCFCNFRYARSKRGGRGFSDVRGLLKYLQFRDDRQDHIPGAGGPNRWVNGGLGESYQEIVARLDRLSPGNKHAYCFGVVISPDPQALEQVEGDPHARFVAAVKATIQEWEDWRRQHDPSQAGPIDYSFVVHRPQREYGEQMHAHLILPAATEHPATRTMTPLYNNRPHTEAFKEIVARQLDHAFDLDRERETPEPEPAIPAVEREIDFIRFFEPPAQDPSQGAEA
jgi:hypothetical protein